MIFYSTAILLFSSTIFGGQIASIPQTAYAQSTSTCENLAIPTTAGGSSSSSITASGSTSGFPPTNTIDNDLNTVWSNFGVGSWIKIDLGAQKTICNLDIAWYKGNQRQVNFVISVSSDGITFTDVFAGKSSGTTLSPERYDFTDVNGVRYVKITVNGNTQNNYATIAEIDVFGISTGTPPPPPPPPTIPDFNFAAAGDWSCDSEATFTVNNIKSKDPERVLALGDLSYQSTADCWLSKISPIGKNKFAIAIGNHDDAEDGSAALKQQYLETFGLPKSYYSFDYQNAHFIALDTQQSAIVGSAQYNFIKNDLEANKDKDWIFVFFHKPFYSTSSLPDYEDRDALSSLFEEYGVDLVLVGHNHHYNRSFPLKFNLSNPSSPTVTSTEKTNYKDSRIRSMSL